MTSFDLAVGASARLTITARGDRDPHRWEMDIVETESGLSRLHFGSWIGGGDDLHQTIEIVAQPMTCRVDVRSGHRGGDGEWKSDQGVTSEPSAGLLEIGFCDPAIPQARFDDVLFSFALHTAGRGA